MVNLLRSRKSVLKERNDKKQLTIDSSVIVSYLLKNEEYSTAAMGIWERVLVDKIRCFQPSICLVEISSAIKRRTSNNELVNHVLKELRRLSHVKFIELNDNRILKTTELIKEYGLKSLDSIYLAVSLEFNTELITFDKEIIRKINLKNYLNE